MSGDCYNYLGFKDADQLVNHLEEIDEIAKRLHELGYEELALNTFCLVKDIEHFFNTLQERQNKLSKILACCRMAR